VTRRIRLPLATFIGYRTLRGARPGTCWREGPNILYRYGRGGCTSNVADASGGIKHFVFDTKKYSGAELLEAIRTNWGGPGALRNERL